MKEIGLSQEQADHTHSFVCEDLATSATQRHPRVALQLSMAAQQSRIEDAQIRGDTRIVTRESSTDSSALGGTRSAAWS